MNIDRDDLKVIESFLSGFDPLDDTAMSLEEIGQARRDAADPERLRPFINDMELCDLEDLAYKGIARRAVRGGTLYVRWQESGRRYWFEDGCHYVELTREQALERF